MHRRFAPERYLSRVATAALTAILVTTAPAASADRDADSGWSRWEALDRGYVGRRKVPPRLELPASERRLETTQRRLRDKAERRAMRQERRAARRGAATAAPTVAVTLAETAALEAESCHSAPVNALMLRTTATGLYSAPISDLAAELGKSASQIRRRAKKGALALTSGSPTAWYYDQTTDSILFAAEAIDSFYTDEKPFRFSLRRRDARPMALANRAPPGAGPGGQMPFTDVRKEEEEPDLWFYPSVVKSEEIDFWFWTGLFGHWRPSVEVPVHVPDPAPAGKVTMRIRMRGATNLLAGDDHQVTAFLVKADASPVELGSMSWDGFEPSVLVADFDQEVLRDMMSESHEVTLRLVSGHPTGLPPWEFLDDVEIKYARAPVAENGLLWMREVQGGKQTVGGFSESEILVIENPSEDAVLRKDVRIDPGPDNDYRVTLQTTPGADYLIAERGAVAPASISPDYRSTLRRRTNTADYLIVAPREFACTAKALAEYRSGRYQDVEIAWVDDIMDEFNNGQDDPVALARFMDRVMTKWRRSPKVVQMIGKATLDHMSRMGYKDSYWPIAMVSTPWTLAASIDRTLGVEGKPPFAIGSLPIVNDAEGQAYVRKLEAYETTARDGLRAAALIADDPDRAGNFPANSDLLADHMLDDGLVDEAITLYHPDDDVRFVLTHEQEGVEAGDLPPTGSRFWEVVDYVTYDGHGSTQQAGDGSENFITALDAEKLQNALFPVFTAWTCAVGDDSIPATRSLAAALVLNPHGGAMSSVVPSGLSADADAQVLGTAFVDAFLGEHEGIGAALRTAKQQTDGSISAFMPAIYLVVGEAGVQAAP